VDKAKKIIIILLVLLLALIVYLILKVTTNVEGSIFVDSFPKECDVYLNGELKGKTPVEVKGLKTGEYIVEVKKDGYKTATKTVELDKNHVMKSVYVPLEHLTFTLIVNSYPEEAEVYIDGVKKGVTPITVEDLILGDHFVEVKRENFEVWKKQINASSGEILQLDALLIPSTTKIVITSVPDKATVQINGEEKGITPFEIAELPPGTYEIVVVLSGYVPYSEKVSIEKGQTVERNIALSKANTFLSIKTNPSECSVYINGELKGKTPYEEANIQPGTYTVKLEKEGYLPYSTEVTITKGKRQELNINLLKLP
jgi:hypothetical protein